MKPQPENLRSSAAIASSLLFAALTSVALAQTPTAPPKAPDEEVLQLEKFTVTTGFRSPKTLDQIPGAIKLISNKEISDTLLLTDDATAVLARTIPGYAEATQSMNNTGETLRGRVALRLFDGISQTTPLREGSRNGMFTDMGIVARIEVHRRRRRHHQLHFQGPDEGRQRGHHHVALLVAGTRRQRRLEGGP